MPWRIRAHCPGWIDGVCAGQQMLTAPWDPPPFTARLGTPCPGAPSPDTDDGGCLSAPGGQCPQKSHEHSQGQAGALPTCSSTSERDMTLGGAQPRGTGRPGPDLETETQV